MYAFLALTLATAAGQQAAAPPAKAEDPIVCQRSDEHNVGTRIKRSRICKPKSEWALDEKRTQQQLRKFNDHRSDPGPASGR